MRYSDLTPDGFFKDYVVPRRPVVMDGCLSEGEGWGGGKWTNEYLRKKVRLFRSLPGRAQHCFCCTQRDVTILFAELAL